MIGIILAASGVALCLLAAAGAAYSRWRMAGTNAGASLSAACLPVALIGAVTALAGAAINIGRLKHGG